MNRSTALRCAANGALLLWATLSASAAVAGELITFDDIALSPRQIQAIPSAYAGFNWGRGFLMFNPTGYPATSGYVVGTVSGSNVGYVFGRQATTMSSTQGPISLLSAWLTGATDASESVDVKGLSGGRVLYDRTVTVSNSKAQLFQFDFAGIDSISFTPAGGNLVLDNIQIGPVPEPESYAMLGLGLCGVLLRRRLRQAPARVG